MSVPIRLHVISPILAITEQHTRHLFVTIPPGAVIETQSDFAEPGLRSVLFGGQDLLAFTRDIRERTESADQENISDQENI
jgi:hypothetical protein